MLLLLIDVGCYNNIKMSYEPLNDAGENYLFSSHVFCFLFRH